MTEQELRDWNVQTAFEFGYINDEYFLAYWTQRVEGME